MLKNESVIGPKAGDKPKICREKHLSFICMHFICLKNNYMKVKQEQLIISYFQFTCSFMLHYKKLKAQNVCA